MTLLTHQIHSGRKKGPSGSYSPPFSRSYPWFPTTMDLVVSVPPHPERAPHLGLLRSPMGQPSDPRGPDTTLGFCVGFMGSARQLAHNQSSLCFQFVLIQNHEDPVSFLLVPSAHTSRETFGPTEGGNTLMRSLTKILPSPSPFNVNRRESDPNRAPKLALENLSLLIQITEKSVLTC